MARPLKFFLGGVPFGCDNIGDEAILACIVRILREDFPGAEITVSTRRPEQTAQLLDVQAHPLYAFEARYPLEKLGQTLRDYDVFLWAGATGLSDYPALALDILSLAQKTGLKTVVWGVGMSDRLNPAFFKMGGKKRLLLSAASLLTFGRVDCVRLMEDFLTRRMKRRICDALKKCDLVVVRDYQTQSLLAATDNTLPLLTGADSAILLDRPDDTRLSELTAACRADLCADAQKIGVCISAQRAIEDIDALARALDSLLEAPNRRMFFIPMNPVTDRALMEKLRLRLRHKERTHLIGGVTAPETVLAIAARCDVVVSSRLHLLILAANAGVPICGVSRGSKVDNFLLQFGIKPAGTVEALDAERLRSQVEHLLAHPENFRAAQEKVYAGLRERLAAAREKLKQTLLPPAKDTP